MDEWNITPLNSVKNASPKKDRPPHTQLPKMKQKQHKTEIDCFRMFHFEAITINHV